MSQRMLLTLIWLMGLFVCLVIVELYVQRTVDDIPFLFPDSRVEYLKPIATIYSVYITGILSAWYVRGFKPPSRDPEAQGLFIIAFICTLAWNICVVYLIGQRHIWPYQGGTLESDLATATQFGAWFSFLVWPVNVYYFGSKPQTPE